MNCARGELTARLLLKRKGSPVDTHLFVIIKVKVVGRIKSPIHPLLVSRDPTLDGHSLGSWLHHKFLQIVHFYDWGRWPLFLLQSSTKKEERGLFHKHTPHGIWYKPSCLPESLAVACSIQSLEKLFSELQLPKLPSHTVRKTTLDQTKGLSTPRFCCRFPIGYPTAYKQDILTADKRM